MILKAFLLLLSIIPLTAVRHYLDFRAHEIFTAHNQALLAPVNLNNQIEVEGCAQFFRKKEVKVFKEMLFFSALTLVAPVCNVSLTELKENPAFAPICVVPLAISGAFALKKFLDIGIYQCVVHKYEKELAEFYTNKGSITFCIQRQGDHVNSTQNYNGPIYNGGHRWIGGNHQ